MNRSEIEHLKRMAKKLKKELAIPHHEALDKAAQEWGFSSYQHFLNSH